MDIISKLYFFIGSLVCHQIQERTIYIGEKPLPFCARDTGIYLGIFIALIYCICRGKLKSDKIPSTRTGILLIMLTVPMMIDAVSSYALIRQTDNTVRLLTGIFFGMPIALFLIPAANYKVDGSNRLKVIDGCVDLLLLTFINVSVAFIILKFDLPAWWTVSTACLSGLVFIISRLGYTVIKLLNIGNPERRGVYSLAITAVTFGMLYIFKYCVIEWIMYQIGDLR